MAVGAALSAKEERKKIGGFFLLKSLSAPFG